MAKAALNRAIKLYGTEVPDGKRRLLTAGPVSAMFDNGALRYIHYRGVEVLRGIAYLLRDKNWGTYGPDIQNLKIDRARMASRSAMSPPRRMPHRGCATRRRSRPRLRAR